MEKAIKGFLILMIALAVFLGGLLISKGLSDMENPPEIRFHERMENKEGSTL